jgi:hypothetical protein
VEKLVETVGRRGVGGESSVDPRIDAEKLDQVNIISRWLENQGDAATCITLEPGWADRGFGGVVDRVLAAARLAAGQGLVGEYRGA